MLVGAAVAAFVTFAPNGGPDLTWNRYVMPYVVFIFLIALRYRRYFNRYFFFLSAIAMAVTVLSFRPSYLLCAFADALVLFGPGRPADSSNALLNVLFLAATVAAAWLWLRKSPFAQRAALLLTGLVWFGTHVAAARLYRNSPNFNVSAYHGIVEKAYQKSRIYPASEVYYDPEFAKDAIFQELRVLFLWPNVNIHPLRRYQFAQLERPSKMHLFYFTLQTLYFSSSRMTGLRQPGMNWV